MTTTKRRKLPPYATAIDRHALHEYLFSKANSRGLVTLSQRALAEQLGIHKNTLNEIFGEMKDAGKIKKIGAHSYKVEDPAPWRT